MTKTQIINKIVALIENGYAETGVSYERHNAVVVATIAAPYGGSRRIEAASYAALLKEVEERVAYAAAGI